MIGYLEGRLLKIEEDKILLLASQIGYEIMLPSIVMEDLKTRSVGEEISLYIYWQQTERQPKPVLIGFNTDLEREFFQYFISVEDIGPSKALKALNIPVDQIAAAIETSDVSSLTKLKGIGKRTAQKMVATLQGKVGKFVVAENKAPGYQPSERMIAEVVEVLTCQLGFKAGEARQLVIKCMEANPEIESAETLLENVLRGRNTK
jgi:Holliday junction DNA helicase RuvA